MSSGSMFDAKISKWLMNQNFYHGYLPREDLPYLLKKKGDWIVRANMKCIGKERKLEYVLSVAWMTNNEPMATAKDIKSLHIDRNVNSVWIDMSKRFPSIGSLIDFYKSTEIRTAKEAIKLLRPIKLQFWEFRHSQIECVKKVGQGAYGEVFKGKVKKGNNKTFEAAIKAMRSDLDAGDEKMKEVMAEARLMRTLNHPNIVRFRGIAVLEQPIYIVIDFITGGGLDSYLKKNAEKLTIDVKNKMAISAAWGIEFMHSHDIIHRDIAARNCLYDAKNLVKLSDFGLSRKGAIYQMKKAMKLPTRWLAPESLTTFTFTRATDVYTFGVLLYEIYTCTEPMSNLNGAEAKRMILAGKFPDFERFAPPELNEIVRQKVYQLDPARRGSMKEIVKQLEQWLEVELVLDDDDIPPVEAESLLTSNRLLKSDDSTNNNCAKKQKTVDEPTAIPQTPKGGGGSKERAKLPKERAQAQKDEKTKESPMKGSSDTREMEMIVPPPMDEAGAQQQNNNVTLGKEFDSVRTQVKPKKN